jgi:Arc/MetJ-type ribon-helix-helix transcriptional regulator
MKERASFTFDKETVEIIDDLVNSGKYRNRSHAVEAAIKLLKEKEEAEKKEREKGGSKGK